MSKLISINELAERVSVHPDTIRKWEQAGYISSIRTLGGHRRYPESEVDHVIHLMKYPSMSFSLNTLESDAWFRKDRFINWKRFVGFHNQQTHNDVKEVCKKKGIEMVLSVLDKLSDDDWRLIDKIDEVLAPIYLWYRKSHEYYGESAMHNMSGGLLRKGTHRVIKDGKDVTQEALEQEEKHFNDVLKRLNLKKPTPSELEIIGFQLDGVHCVLWGISGIAMGGETSVLKGAGSFPHEREQMELDKKNGWDGNGDFSAQREKLNKAALHNMIGDNMNYWHCLALDEMWRDQINLEKTLDDRWKQLWHIVWLEIYPLWEDAKNDIEDSVVRFTEIVSKDERFDNERRAKAIEDYREHTTDRKKVSRKIYDEACRDKLEPMYCK